MNCPCRYQTQTTPQNLIHILASFAHTPLGINNSLSVLGCIFSFFHILLKSLTRSSISSSHFLTSPELLPLFFFMPVKDQSHLWPIQLQKRGSSARTMGQREKMLLRWFSYFLNKYYRVRFLIWPALSLFRFGIYIAIKYV